MRLAALATGLFLLALAGNLDRDLMPDALSPGPFETLIAAQFDRSGLDRRLRADPESHPQGTRTAALGAPMGPRISE